MVSHWVTNYCFRANSYTKRFSEALRRAAKIHSDFVTADDRVFRELCSSPFCCTFFSNNFFSNTSYRAFSIFACGRSSTWKRSEKRQFETQYIYYTYFYCVILHLKYSNYNARTCAQWCMVRTFLQNMIVILHDFYSL